MIAVLTTLTPGLRNEFSDCQKAKVCIMVLPIMDVKTRWTVTLELLVQAYRLREFTCEWLKSQTYSDSLSLFTIQDTWTNVKYVMVVLWPIQNSMLWMLKWYTVTLHQVISMYNYVFHHMDGIIRALAKK